MLLRHLIKTPGVRWLALTALAMALVAAWVAPARADRLADLARKLEQDRDEKSRIAAAVALGRLSDTRAVPAFIHALEDKSTVVRGVAASALGHLGDGRAIVPLERALSDSSEAVRVRARDALALLRADAVRPVKYASPNESPRLDTGLARAQVVVKSATNKTDRGGVALGERMKAFMVTELSNAKEVTLEESPRARLASFIVDGSITNLRRTNNGSWVEIRCEVRISISNSEGRMLSVVTGGATVQIPKSTWERGTERAFQLQALENAVKGAHENLLAYIESSI